MIYQVASRVSSTIFADDTVLVLCIKILLRQQQMISFTSETNNFRLFSQRIDWSFVRKKLKKKTKWPSHQHHIMHKILSSGVLFYLDQQYKITKHAIYNDIKQKPTEN